MKIEDLIAQVGVLSLIDLGHLRRVVNGEYETRLRFMPTMTDEERALPSKLDRVKAVRNRTGLGLADAKEFVERCERGEQPCGETR
jgi:hypothetical protein